MCCLESDGVVQRFASAGALRRRVICAIAAARVLCAALVGAWMRFSSLASLELAEILLVARRLERTSMRQPMAPVAKTEASRETAFSLVC